MSKAQRRIVKKIRVSTSSNCLMCSNMLKGVGYEYQAQQFVPDYVPPKRIVCKNCVYRECFGSKNYRQKMKQGVLDGKTETSQD